MNPIYINTNENLIRHGGRRGVNTNLHGKTLYKALSRLFERFAFAYVNEFPATEDTTNPFSEVNGDICIDDNAELYYEFAEFLTQHVSADLDKVSFDTENIECNAEYGDGYDKDVIGYHVLENGFEFVGFIAGGDWEDPLCFIIYHDGNRLRGYIPVCGNTYNTDFDCAFGSEAQFGLDLSSAKARKAVSVYKSLNPNFDEDDMRESEEAIKMFLLKNNHIPLDDPMYDSVGHPGELLYPECSLMIKDIMSRIIVS